MGDEKILVCDVDGVVVDLSYDWFLYLKSIVKDYDFTYEELASHYDFWRPLEKYISKQEAYHFWKKATLYDGRQPIKNAAETLWELKKYHGFDIVFASHCEGNHSKSKFEFLKRHFPVDCFAATREKQYFRAAVAIDDRIDHLVNQPYNVGKILKFTTHEQTCERPFKPDGVLYEWGDNAIQLILDVYKRKQIVY